MKVKALFAAALLGLFGAAYAQDWGDTPDTDSFYAENTASKALCRQLRTREPPAGDRPDAAQRRSLAGCRSDALYYGIGMTRDPVRARQCAFAEMDEHRDDSPFSGRAMLMMIYANGEGAARDLDVAIHLACGVEGAPAESHLRVTHLAELKAGGWAGHDFDYCDDITSGLAGGYCAGREQQRATIVREAALERLAAPWPAADRQAFAALRRTHEAFVEAHGSNEVDLSGTLRAAMVIAEEESEREAFLELLRGLAAGRAPHPSRALAAADARLNAAYRALRRADRDMMGTVTMAGIRETQRAWLLYRDAFLAFVAREFPAMPRAGLAALLTEQRTAFLVDLRAPQ